MASTSPSTADGSCCFNVSEAEIEKFEEDGFLILRSVLSGDQLRSLEEGMEWNLSHPGPLAAVASLDTDPGKFFEDFCCWSRIPQYKKVMFEALPEIASKLLRSKTVRLYHDHVLIKEANTIQHTPWHQDQPYYNITGKQNVSFWMPLDSIPKESSLQLVAGSHKSGKWYMPRTFLTQQAKWFPEGSLPEAPADIRAADVQTFDMEPGDVIAFHMLTLHGTAGTKNRRRVFSARYIGDDIRHAPRAWKTSPEFPATLKEELPAGSEMDHPLFPVVYTMQSRAVH